MSAKVTHIEEQFGQLGEKRFYHIEENQVVQIKHKNFAAGSLLAWVQNLLRFVLLPQGYPSSVSDDYMEYQLWDTLQAFCSYLSGTLTTKAIMQGVGVGDAAATPLAATITWIMRDGTGMIGRIVFASWKGPELDTNCKKWRLAADILNDMAMSLELSSPFFPEAYFPIVLCVATSMKAIVGVAGGATRAALTQHQAKQGNMADVAAKDGSQETLVNLIASNIGIVVLPLVTKDEVTWLLFGLLTLTHLFANYSAVRCLNIPILNGPRYNILYHNQVTENKILSPKEVNSQEPVIIGQSKFSAIFGWNIRMGESILSFSADMANQIQHSTTLTEDYLVLVSKGRREIAVIFRKGAKADPSRAYYNALCIGHALERDEFLSEESIMTCLSKGAKETNANYENFKTKAAAAGWMMERHQLLVNEWVAEWKRKKAD